MSQPVLPGSAQSEERVESLLMYRVATSHFRDGLSNLEIANALGISRFRVARLLEQAAESGVVQPRVDLPIATEGGLAAELADRFGLRAAVVIPAGEDPQWQADAVSAAAIRHVGSLLKEGDLLGVAWGRTLDTVASVGSHLHLTLPQADVVRLVGGVPSETGSLDASDLVRRFSMLTGGRSLVLNAPIVVPSAEIADGLRGERSVAETLQAGRDADVALFGVGAWQPDRSAFWNVMDTSARKVVADAAVVADVCGILLTADGEAAETPLTAQTVGIRLDELRAVPRRVAVVFGEGRAEATAAVIRARAASDLIVDAQTARELLDN